MFDRREFIGSGAAAAMWGLSPAGVARAEPSGELRGFKGELFTPGEPQFDQIRQILEFNPVRPPKPKIIAVCADEDDVRRAIDYATSRGLNLSVKSGGHDIQAACICNGIVVDLQKFNTITIDEAARTVRVGTGVRSGELNAALLARGLVPVLGCDPKVGVGGLVLGGGLGWLAGTHGAACDHLLGARIVTADGRTLEVSQDKNADLLWGLRGAGWNFGIVTEMTLRVHPAPKQVVTGMLVFEGDRIADFFKRYRDYLASASDAVDLELTRFAPRGRPIISVKTSYSGPPEQADKVLGPLRAVGPLLTDTLRASPYTGIIAPDGKALELMTPIARPRLPDDVPGFHWAAVAAAPFSDAALEFIEARLKAAPVRWGFGFGQIMHGAVVRVPPEHSALQRIDQLLNGYLSTFWRRPEQAQPSMAWVDETIAMLQPYSAPAYPNLLSSPDPQEVRRSYGAAYPRLAALKRKYDPANLFRHNRNILPAG